MNFLIEGKQLLIILVICLFLITNICANLKKRKLNNKETLPIVEIARLSRIAAKYVSGAHITEIVDDPGPRARAWISSNYQRAKYRRLQWSCILKTLKEPILGYKVEISIFNHKNPPPVQTFMKSENQLEMYHQCLNVFNFIHAQAKSMIVIPEATRPVLKVLLYYICYKSVQDFFEDNWPSSVMILREIISMAISLSKTNKIEKLRINTLISEFSKSPYSHEIVPINKSQRYMNIDMEGYNIWQYALYRSQILYSSEIPIRMQHQEELSYIVMSGSPVPPTEFLSMRNLQLLYTESLQFTTALIFSIILLKVRNTLPIRSLEVNIYNINKMPKKFVKINVLLAFAARIARDYVYVRSEWFELVNALLELDLEEKQRGNSPILKWNGKMNMPLNFEPDIVDPQQLITNCVRSLEQLSIQGTLIINSVQSNSGPEILHKLENICTRVQHYLLPYSKVYANSQDENKHLKSILKKVNPFDYGEPKKKNIKFAPNVKVSSYVLGSKPSEIDDLGYFTLDTSLKTTMKRSEFESTARYEIPILYQKQATNEDEVISEIFDNKFVDTEYLLVDTPYPKSEYEFQSQMIQSMQLEEPEYQEIDNNSTKVSKSLELNNINLDDKVKVQDLTDDSNFTNEMNSLDNWILD
ncbi:uncharacterized protein CMU_013910 [Cryptosporidium muris RN66]|uniref:Uncharacterized protein n=1 Tax=Cryptosporidium muris (strain RN66) TaxID=441375 RepID=B6AEU9_CRYMR|nr:uncharacterized protein CMU_013910 [Cryptosporidium muris RN66]EEA06716.1 hypothetical protein, conserved [Cryptosporidium muris RN66]|eukprot:XP_002141065.1 hypothetical protein [Cryptosporidium muris RN66]